MTPHASADTSTESGPPDPAVPGATTGSSPVVPVLRDVAVVVLWFAVAGLVGAWVWAHVTPLPQVTKVGNNGVTPSEELVKQVAMDGWFFVIAMVVGLVSGVLLMHWRRRDPLLTVALVTLGGGLASWLMVHVGHALGPGNEQAALSKLAEGAHVSEQLSLHAPGVAWVWPITAAFGALIYLWVLEKPDGDAGGADTLR